MPRFQSLSELQEAISSKISGLPPYIDSVCVLLSHGDYESLLKWEKDLRRAATEPAGWERGLFIPYDWPQAPSTIRLHERAVEIDSSGSVDPGTLLVMCPCCQRELKEELEKEAEREQEMG